MFNGLTPVPIIRKYRANDIGLPKTGGVYKWWCDIQLYSEFLRQLQAFGVNYSFLDINKYIESIKINGIDYYCFYVGQTKTSLASRIKSQHVGKLNKINPEKGHAIKGSTLRRSINSLKDNNHGFDESYVDNVLNHCYVQWEALTASEIDEVERTEINSFIRLLNRDDFIDNGQDFLVVRDTIAKALKMARTK